MVLFFRLLMVELILSVAVINIRGSKSQIMAERDAVIAGKHVFTGPLVDVEGNERVAAGETMGDADLWGMDWFVDGVITQ